MADSFVIGLTNNAIAALLIGQVIKLNTGDMGFPAVPIQLYYGGSDEDIAKPNPEFSAEKILTREETE